MVVGVAVCRDCRWPVNGCSRCRKSVVVSLMIMYDDTIDINAGTFGRNAMIRVVLSPPMPLLSVGEYLSGDVHHGDSVDRCIVGTKPPREEITLATDQQTKPLSRRNRSADETDQLTKPFVGGPTD